MDYKIQGNGASNDGKIFIIKSGPRITAQLLRVDNSTLVKGPLLTTEENIIKILLDTITTSDNVAIGTYTIIKAVKINYPITIKVESTQSYNAIDEIGKDFTNNKNKYINILSSTLSSSEVTFDLNIDLDEFRTGVDDGIKLKRVVDDISSSIRTILTRNKIKYKDESTGLSLNQFLVAEKKNVGYNIVYKLGDVTVVTSTTTTSTTTLPPTDEQIEASNNETPKNENISDDNNTESSVQGSEKVPGITNIFKNTYAPSPIKMEMPSSDQYKDEVVQSTGFLPFIWYNSFQISYVDISYFKMDHNGICPTIKIIFYDSVGLMKDNGIPIDDTKIKVFLNSRSKNLKSIFLEFKITNFSVDKGLFNINGIMDVDGLFLPSFKAYKEKSSYEVMQDICKEYGLGFNSNLDGSDDKMNWINTGNKVYDFIDDVLTSSYKSDASFILGYFDFYYNFNYVDIELELSREVSAEEGIGTYGMETAVGQNKEDVVNSLILTNDPSMSSSNGYIEKYKIINNSTNISLNDGYLTKAKYYGDNTKELMIFDIDSISTEGNKIVMKSGNQDFYSKNINLVYNGKMDSDNAHVNYNYSSIQNDRNISEISKLALDVVLSTPNYNIYRYQKIKVLITSDTATPAHKNYNERLTGDWFVIDVVFELRKGKFYQKLILVKREMEALPGEEYQDPQSEYGENNDNGGVNNLDNSDVSGNAVSPINSQTKSSEKMKPLIEAFKYWRINDKYLKKAILANIKKENGDIVPKGENLKGYANTSNARIRKIFGRRVAAFSEVQLTAIKQNEKQWAEVIYGVNANNGTTATLGLGNDKPGDGYKYKGRGYIQLTGKALYKKFGDYAKINIVDNPDLLITDPYKSAIVAVGYIAYFNKSVKFQSQTSANRAVTQYIGGRGLNLDSGYGAELLAKVNSYSDDFEGYV